jgi:hypothetical protein
MDAMDSFFTRRPLKLEKQVKLSDGGVTKHIPAHPYVFPGLFLFIVFDCI